MTWRGNFLNIFYGVQLFVDALTSKQTAIDAKTWISNDTPLFYMDLITYPCPNFS